MARIALGGIVGVAVFSFLSLFAMESGRLGLGRTPTVRKSHAKDFFTAARETAEIRARQRNNSVVYVHVQKTGGTTLCHLAKLNGYRANFTSNCIWQLGDNVSDAERLEDFLSNGRKATDFVALEGYELPMNAPPPGEVVYVATIRNPLNRLLSKFENAMAFRPRPGLSFARLIMDFAAGKGPPAGLSQIQMNSFVRTFGDCPISNKECSHLHLTTAMWRLENLFSVVLISDTPRSFALSSKMLSTRLGWSEIDVNSNRRGTKAHSSALQALADRPEAFAQLVKLNKLDLELYDFALDLAFKRLGDDPNCVYHWFDRLEVYELLQGKWLAFAGDSDTRGLVLALLHLLDGNQTAPFDARRWWNVSTTNGDETRVGYLDWTFKDGVAIAKTTILLEHWNKGTKTCQFHGASSFGPREFRVSFCTATKPAMLTRFASDLLISDYLPSLVYFNNGAWLAEESYPQLLAASEEVLSIVARVAAKGIPLVWGTTLPIRDNSDRFDDVLLPKLESVRVSTGVQVLDTRNHTALLALRYFEKSSNSAPHLVNLHTVQALVNALPWHASVQANNETGRKKRRLRHDPACAGIGLESTSFIGAWRAPCRVILTDELCS